MAEIAVRRIKVLGGGAAGEASLGVVDDAVAVDDGAIQAFVAQIGQPAPARGVGLRNPQVINTETPARSAVAKHYDALARRGIVTEQGWNPCGGPFAVRRRQIEGRNRVGALSGNRGAEKAVARDGIAARAVVPH